MGYIYILTSPKGKSYIGQTIRPIEVRLEEHRTGRSKGCRGVYNAIQYHGWENFVIDWYECPDEDLNKHEELMVEVLGTLSPGGYNLREGGGNRGKPSEESKQKMSEAQRGEKSYMFGIPKSEEHKKKVSEAQRGDKGHWYGKKRTEETKQKLREATGGEKNPFYGKIHTEETKQRVGEAQLGEKNHNSKKVYQYDLNGIFIDSFGSSGEAARHLNIKNGSHIGSCARGEQSRKTAYGFKWSYTMDIFM